MTPRLGARFVRDASILLETRERELDVTSHLGYPKYGGCGLTWIVPWPEEQQLQLKDLDIWFIEVCRRVRLYQDGTRLAARKGISKSQRVNAKHLKGVLGDPFAPIHKTKAKSLTLGRTGFDYRLLIDLLLSGEWKMPLLALLGPTEQSGQTMGLLAEAFVRGQGRTEGFRSRILPLSGAVTQSLGLYKRKLHELALQQVREIEVFSKAIRLGLARCAIGGDDLRELKKQHYAHGRPASLRFDRVADGLFFDYLWDRFEAQEKSADALEAAENRFARVLYNAAKRAFEAALPAVPCARVFRYRAETQARSAFFRSIWSEFPHIFEIQNHMDTPSAN